MIEERYTDFYEYDILFRFRINNFSHESSVDTRSKDKVYGQIHFASNDRKSWVRFSLCY